MHELRPGIKALAADPSALVVVNHSGGKDSQAMLIHLLAGGLPVERMVVVHASLGRMEWPGALEHAEAQAHAAGLPFIVARAGKDLLEMVERRHRARPEVPSWPSASTRQCTSDLKRGPIQREVRRYADAHGFRVIANCMGFRAQESPARARRSVISRNAGQSNSRRIWYDTLPIHDWQTEEVFRAIQHAGQEPHYAYALGNDRLSCVFCIMASLGDLANGVPDAHEPQTTGGTGACQRRRGDRRQRPRATITSQ